MMAFLLAQEKEKIKNIYKFILLKSKFSTSIKGEKVKLPTAFTEKGLYMLASILKSQTATETTQKKLKVIIDPHNLQFSPNSKTLYFETSAWVTSGAIHAVDVNGNHLRYVTS